MLILSQEDVEELVFLSDDIKKARLRRVKGLQVQRPSLISEHGAIIGPRSGPRKKERDGFWTEITKDLVVKEAIMQAGYDFEETDDFYYIMNYLKYVSSRFRLALAVRECVTNADSFTGRCGGACFPVRRYQEGPPATSQRASSTAAESDI